MDDSMFRQKGAGVPRGSESTAEDAVPSELSGGAVRVPVWKSFVGNKDFQERQAGAIAAEKSMLAGMQRGSGARWGGDNGRLFRKVGGTIEEYDAEQLAEDPEAGPFARKSLFDRERRSAAAEYDEYDLKIQDPSFKARGLTDKDRQERQFEYEALPDTDPRKAQAKAAIDADDQYRAEKAEIERRKYEAKVRATQLGNLDPDTWWANRAAIGQARKPAPVEQAQAARGEAQAAEDSAMGREKELDAELMSGVSAARLAQIKAEKAEIAQARSMAGEQQVEADMAVEGVRQEAQAKVDQSVAERGFWADTIAALKRGYAGAAQSANILQGATDAENAQDIADYEKMKQANPASAEFQEFLNAKGFAESAAAFIKNPVSIVSEVIAESAAQMVPSIGLGFVGGAAGGALTSAPTAGSAAPATVPIGAVVGSAIGAGAGSYLAEYGNAMLQSMQEAGMDASDPKSVQAFFGDEQKLAVAKEFAVKRGIPIAIFDAVSMGLAGKFMKPVQVAAKGGAKVTAGQILKASGKELAAQAAAGAGGEAAAQLASGGEISDGKAIFLEGIAEVGFAPLEVASNLREFGSAAPGSKEADLMEQTKTALTAIDPEAAPPTPQEVGDAAFITGQGAGVEGLAESVVIERELAGIDAEDTAAVDAADKAVADAKATGDAATIKAAETARESVIGGRAHLVRAVLKIASGRDISTLTDNELRSIGYKADKEKPGEYVELDADDAKAAGITKPMVRRGADESVVITDEALKRVEGILPRARARVKMGETEALDKAQQRANTPEWEVDTSAGPVRVKATSPEDAERIAAETYPLGQTVRPGSAKQVSPSPAGTAAVPGGGATANPAAGNQSSNETGKPQSQTAAPANQAGAQGNPAGTSGGTAGSAKPAAIPGEKALAAAQKRFEQVKKKLGDRIREGSKRANTLPEGIEINPQQIVEEAIKGGMDEKQAAQYFSRVLDEEVRHLAQYDAAEKLRKALNSPLSLDAFIQQHYGAIWQNDFVATGKDKTVFDIYAKGNPKAEASWKTKSDASKALEAIRMMSQGDKITEAGKLWVNISDTLRQALEAALAALKEFIDIASPILKTEIQNLENALKQLNKPRGGTSKAGGKKPASGQSGAGTGGAAPQGGNSSPDSNGGTQPPPSDGAGAPLSVGARVSFVSSSPVLGDMAGQRIEGVVTLIQNGSARVRPDFDPSISVAVPVDELTVEQAAKPQEKPASNEIGRNKNGDQIFTDANGVRYLEDNGFRITQPVDMRPTRDGVESVPVSPQEMFDRGNLRFLTETEVEQMRAAKAAGGKDTAWEVANMELLAEDRARINAALVGNQTVVNAIRNSDPQNARIEIDKQIRSILAKWLNAREIDPKSYTYFSRMADNPVWIDSVFKSVGKEIGNTATPNQGGEIKIGDTVEVESWDGEKTTGKVIAISKSQDGKPVYVLEDGSSGGVENTVKISDGGIQNPLPNRDSLLPEQPQLTPEEEQAKKDLFDAFDGLVDGLEAAPLPDPEFYRERPPTDRLPQMQKAAQSLISAGVDTPGKLAEFLEKVAPNKLRQFSEFLWRQVNSFLMGDTAAVDWNEIYNASTNQDATIKVGDWVRFKDRPDEGPWTVWFKDGDRVKLDSSTRNFSFNIDNFEKVDPPQEEESAPETAAAYRLASQLAERIKRKEKTSIQELTRMASEVYGGRTGEGFDIKTAYDSVEMAINILIGESGMEVNVSPEQARQNLETIRGWLEYIPTQTRRTGEMDAMQQFSTPPHFSYIASWVAAVGNKDVGFEPSAGLGGLAAWMARAGADVRLNELSPRRREMLDQMHIGPPATGHDAGVLHSLLLPAINNGSMPQPTVVVMNPPFSNNAAGRKDLLTGAKHIDEALKLLPPGGRLVAIVGEGMALEAPKYKPWWDRIRRDHNVRANIHVDGREYAKYGTTFSNRILVIDKVPPTGESIVGGEVTRIEDLIPLLDPVKTTRPTPNENAAIPGNPPPSNQQGGIAPTPQGGNGPSGSPRTPGAGSGSGSAGQGGSGGLGGGAGSNAGGQVNGGNNATDSGSDNAGANPDGQPDGRGGQDSSGVAPKLDTEVERDEASAERNVDENEVFTDYTPTKFRLKGSQPHPTTLVESSAMATTELPASTATLNLPKEVVASGELSDAQLEAIAYAVQAHESVFENGERQGFFIGDGTGVGKGREIAGTILHNWREGRRKAVWITEKKDLVKDARRDFDGIGGKDVSVYDMAKNVPAPQGDAVAFLTYDGLKGNFDGLTPDGGIRKSDAKKPARIQNLLNWLGADFDGLIALDEVHNAGNALAIKGSRGTKQPSQKAIAVVELQKVFPKARFLYVSATGATEPNNLAFASRLGMWGPGKAFRDAVNFYNQIKSAGISAMEIVARDLKAMGLYVARTLSFKGQDGGESVTFTRLEHTLTPDQEVIYGKAAEAWQTIFSNIDRALSVTGAANSSRARNAAASAFWGSQQRFFNGLLTAMQMPSAIADMKQKLEEGGSIVIQLINTNEEALNRAIARALAENPTNPDYENVDLSSRQDILEFIHSSYPVNQYVEVPNGVDSQGNPKTQWVLLTDEEGNAIPNPQAVAMRDALLDEMARLPLPDPPLEQIIRTFGAEAVAEITGRDRRLIEKTDDRGITRRVVERRNDSKREKEKNDFLDGKRRILMFSDKGGTGFSYHAGANFKNQQKRYQYVVQAGWRADKAIQGLGRTHRADQVKTPAFILVSTNVSGHKRFISTIARRLQQLGALTSGERKTTGQGLFDDSDNIEDAYGDSAVTRFFFDLFRGEIPGLGFDDITRKLGFQVTRIDPTTGEEVTINKLLDDAGLLNTSKIPELSQFLNRILALPIQEQNSVFDAFMERREVFINAAKQSGSYDAGVETFNADEPEIEADEEVYQDPNSSAATRLVEIKFKRFFSYNDFDFVTSLAKNPKYVVSRDGKRVYALGQTDLNVTMDDGRVLPGFKRYTLKNVSIEPKENYTTGPRPGKAKVGDQFTHNGTQWELIEIDSENGKARIREVGVDREKQAMPTGELRSLYEQTGNVVDGVNDNSHYVPDYFELDQAEAQSEWNRLLAAEPKFEEKNATFIVGSTLPIWHRIPFANKQVKRVKMDDGSSFLGMLVPEDKVDDTRAQLGASASEVTPAKARGAIIERGARVELSNGWVMKRTNSAGEQRIEVVGVDHTQWGTGVEPAWNRYGYIERINFAPRYFLRTDLDSIDKLLRYAPATQIIEGLQAAELPTLRADSPEWKSMSKAQRADYLKKKGGLNAAELPDAEYMAAVERGDMDTAQRMVDEAAKAAGWKTEAWQGHISNLGPVYKKGKRNPLIRDEGEKNRFGFYFSADEEGAKPFAGVGGELRHLWLKMTNPLDLRELGSFDGEDIQAVLDKAGVKYNFEGGEEMEVWRNLYDGDAALSKAIQKAKYDGVIFNELVRREDKEVLVVFRPEQIKSADSVTRDAQGNVIPLSKRFNSASNSILEAAPLPETDANIGRLRSKIAGEMNKPLLDEARRQQAAFGNISTPRLANPGNTERSRAEQDIVDALYEHERQVRKDRDVFAEARRRVNDDPNGVEEKLLQIAEGKTFATDDADHVAFAMLINQRAAEAGNDLTKHEANMALRMAYRAMRADTARELRIGYDKFMKPEERARKAIADAIYTPTLAIEKRAAQLNFSPEKQREYIRQAASERLQSIEKALKKMGVTLDEILSGQAFLSLSQNAILKQALAVRTAEERTVVKMLQAKTPLERIKKKTGFTEERIEGIRAMLYEELLEKVDGMVRAGMKLENFKDAMKGLQAADLPGAGLTEEQIMAEKRRIVEIGFGIPRETPKASVAKPKRIKPKADTDPHQADWTRPVFTDGLNDYEFDTKDRAEIMKRVEAIRGIASATGKINTLTGKKRAQAEALLKEIDAILAKYGTDSEKIFEAAKPVEEYAFNIHDRAHVAAIARAIQAIDADIVDKGLEWVYSSILSGIQTMTVNATAAIPAAWDMTVGRGFEMAVNALFRDKNAATPNEVKYILKAARPALARAMSNASATWGSELPMFDEDFLGKAADLDKLFDGHAPKIGVIGGTKGRIIRVPLRILLATDEFNRTAIAVAEVGAMAYRVAQAQGLKPGTPEFDKFLAKEVNTAGSFSAKLAAEKASKLIFTNPLPGQTNPITDERAPIEGIGDVVGAGAALLNSLVTTKTDNLFAKALLAILRVSFFPFQRTPFNLIRRGVRHTLNPISLIDIAVLMTKNSITVDANGKIRWKWNAKGRNPEIIVRLSQQLQGAALLTALMAMAYGEGDEDDQDKSILITGSQPFTLKGMAEREAQMRSGLGPYRISFRRKDGSERFGFNYGRIEPLATTLGTTIDSIKAYKRTNRAGADGAGVASSVLGGLVAQAQDKTYLQGFADLFSLVNNALESDESLKDNRKFQQFMASRVAMAFPNIIKQPIREADPMYRSRAEDFMQELLYQAVPYGQKQAKADPYGRLAEKTGTPLGRMFDVTDTGTDPVNPYDKALLRWRDSGQGKPWFPAPIVNGSFKNTRTGKEQDMTQEQLAEFRDIAGKRVTAMLKREAINLESPTIIDIEKIKEAHSKARSEAKKMIAYKHSR